MTNNYIRHEQIFLTYVDSFLQNKNEPCLILKREHTLRVVSNTEHIINRLDLSEEDRYCARLIALYHDIGRFLQYETYKTFLDSASKNHAHITIQVLKKHNMLDNEPETIRKKILSAIILQNKLEFPKKLPEEILVLAKIIQDADKLDIIFVMAENFTHSLPEKDSVVLHVKDEPEAYSEHILDLAIRKMPIKYTDLVYVNDFKILLCGWIFSLHFKESLKLLIRQGYLRAILSSLPDGQDIRIFQSMINKELCINDF